MRLTKAQIQNLKSDLSQWHSPDKMIECADVLMDQLGDADLFNQPGIEFVREAWVAGQFSTVRRAKFVRLIAEDRPDIALWFDNNDMECYELIEADSAERKRGREYKQAASTGQNLRHVHREQWLTGQQAFEVISSAVNKKIEKAKELKQQAVPYPPGTHLLIYLNITDYGAHRSDIEAVFSRAAEPARNCFSSIWILWNNCAYFV